MLSNFQTIGHGFAWFGIVKHCLMLSQTAIVSCEIHAYIGSQQFTIWLHSGFVSIDLSLFLFGGNVALAVHGFQCCCAFIHLLIAMDVSVSLS